MAAKKAFSPLDTMGERTQQLRKNAGLTQAGLAARIEISNTQMARYENKNIYPRRMF
ncbi:MAG: helix-turn-helix transcriptional regulator [Chitinophagaceae bacterium]|nr:helix-turn-helix transcriptional regulator [Chitinophagaceae bacterium]